MYTRREFLVTSASASLLGARAAAQTPDQTPSIGYMSVRRDNRLAIFTMDPATGKVAWREQVPIEGGPDPLAFDPRHRFLYVACRDRRQLSSYRIDPSTGGLSLIGTVPIEGEPIQIVIDRTGRFLLSVYFYQSTIGVHAINEQGKSPPRRWNGA